MSERRKATKLEWAATIIMILISTAMVLSLYFGRYVERKAKEALKYDLAEIKSKSDFHKSVLESKLTTLREQVIRQEEQLKRVVK